MGTLISDMARLKALCRILAFDLLNSIGWWGFVERTPGIQIKEPFRAMYKRSLKKNTRT